MRKRRALALTSALLVLTVGFTVGIASPRSVRDADDGRQEVDVSAPATLIGDVLVQTDSQGRLAVVVDEGREDAMPDGLADRVFILQSSQPVAEIVSKRMYLASVIFGGRTLHVSSPGTDF